MSAAAITGFSVGAPTRIAAVQLAKRFDLLCARLPRGWTQLPVRLVLSDPGQGDRASTVLGPLSPGRSREGFNLRTFAPGQGTPGVDAVRRALAHLDAEGISGRLVTEEASDPGVRPSLVALASNVIEGQWESLSEELPPAWSDVLLELRLASTGDIDRAALLLGPVNPMLQPDGRAFRFRTARTFGYGASTGMTRRVFQRLDDQGVGGSLRVIRVLSDSRPVATQGPVWRIGGRSV